MEHQNQPSDTYLEGYAVKWGDQTQLGNGLVTEVIGKDSFNWDDLVVIYGHDRQSIPLGRLNAGTMEAKPDDVGIYVKVKLPRNRKDIEEAAERQDIVGWSWDINSPKYEWKGNTGTLRKNTVTEFTLTPFPQYKNTTLKVTKK